MPSFGLFRKQKNPDQPEQTAENMPEPETEPEQTETTPEAPVEETLPDETVVAPESPVTVEPEVVVAPPEPDVPAQQVSCKAYLKAMPLRDLSDIEGIKNEVQNGNILILRITPLASKSIESVKSAVNELYSFTESIGGDIARLGEERVVICPKNIRIWREKAPIKNEAASTAA
jgi:SepF-like predicted cell division protein (DUF552 family)